MSYLEEKLLKMKSEAHNNNSAFLMNDSNIRTKDSYVKNASTGTIVAFRLNFESDSGEKLTKVISGKVVLNNTNEQAYIIETRNGLKYGAPYSSIVWVKTGSRWPRGVYEEMKRGEVLIDNIGDNEVVEMNSFDIEE